MNVLEKRSVTFSPEALRLNPSLDSDAARRIWEFAQQVAETGRPLVVAAAEETFSLAEVAAMLGVSVSTLQRHIADGTLEAVRRGAYWRIADSEVDRYNRWQMGQIASVLADDDE